MRLLLKLLRSSRGEGPLLEAILWMLHPWLLVPVVVLSWPILLHPPVIVIRSLVVVVVSSTAAVPSSIASGVPRLVPLIVVAPVVGTRGDKRCGRTGMIAMCTRTFVRLLETGLF